MPSDMEHKDVQEQQGETSKKNRDVEHQPLLQRDNNKKVTDEARTEASYSVKEFLLLVALAGLSRLLAAVSKICVQALQDRMLAFELNAFRCLLPFCGWAIYFTLKRKWPRIEPENIKACLLWSINQILQSVSAYICVVFIPLATSDTILITSNITSSLIVFVLILKRDWNWSQVVCYIQYAKGSGHNFTMFFFQP